MIFRFGERFNLRNPPAHRGDFFLLTGAAAVMTTGTALHLLMELTGHGDKQTSEAIHHSAPLNRVRRRRESDRVYPSDLSGTVPAGTRHPAPDQAAHHCFGSTRFTQSLLLNQ